MIILKRSQLNEVLKTQDYATICEDIRKKHTAPFDKKYDIFLCHSTNDIEEISALKAYFSRNGKKAYVAEIDDPDLNSNKIDYTTAQTLQRRMSCSDELYYVLSKNSQSSTWMPWELGIADVSKTNENITLFPSSNNTNMKWAKQEYLGLYDRISYGRFKKGHSEVWMVWNYRDDTAIELRAWLRH